MNKFKFSTFLFLLIMIQLNCLSVKKMIKKPTHWVEASTFRLSKKYRTLKRSVEQEKLKYARNYRNPAHQYRKIAAKMFYLALFKKNKKLFEEAIECALTALVKFLQDKGSLSEAQKTFALIKKIEKTRDKVFKNYQIPDYYVAEQRTLYKKAETNCLKVIQDLLEQQDAVKSRTIMETMMSDILVWKVTHSNSFYLTVEYLECWEKIKQMEQGEFNL